MLPGLHRIFHKFLTESWRRINAESLQHALRPPVFQISDHTKTLGRWDPQTRTLSIAAKMLLNHSELEVEEVLRHEMAHQYVDEVLKARQHPGETAHGGAFRHACTLLGIGSSARFNPVTEPSPLMRRIQKLLALAESQNLHEAESAMAMARALMEKYEIELGLEDSEFRYQYLGKPHKQKSLALQFIGIILVRYFNIKLVWIPSNMITTEKRVWLMEISGTPTNLEVAGYVYDYLQRELDWLWMGHRASNPAIKGISAKREFQAGVLKGFLEKLKQSEEAEATSEARALILMRKEKLSRFFNDRHPNLVKGRGTKYRKTANFHAGFDKGQELEFRKGVNKKDTLGISG